MAKKTTTMSKSDEVLNAQLSEITGTTSLKANVSFAEALAESGQTAAELTAGAKPKRQRVAKDPNAEPKLTNPRVRIPAGSSPSEILAAYIPNQDERFAAVKLHRGDEADEANYNAVMSNVAKLAQKVREKAINLIRHRRTPTSLQVYTRIGMEQLIANGELTSKGLTEHFQKVKYSIGTARAQSNQIMQLLPALGVAEQSGKGSLVLNKQSTIVADFNKNQG